MIYKLSQDSFDDTFALKADGAKLTHNSGIRCKIFPYTAHTSSETVCDLKLIIGHYLSQINAKEPMPFTAEDLISRLKDDSSIEIAQGMEKVFEQVVRHMFFEKDGSIRPVNLKMLAQIPCRDRQESKLADYLVDVLGDVTILSEIITRASKKIDEQNNVLERLAGSKLESKASTREPGSEYLRITNALQKNYEADFEYILGARSRVRDYLIPLLEFYYFSYTAQSILQLNRFMDGDRNTCVPLYFSLEWERTSQNRRSFSEGWNLLQEAVNRIFAHAIVLEILNQTEENANSTIVDYIALNELINISLDEDHRIAEEIKHLTDRYRSMIKDCPEMAELKRTKTITESETATEVKYLFNNVKIQFENTGRERPYNSYASKFKEYCKKFLKQHGRNGMMLNLTEETLIFLTKVCIKDQEKMRLNNVFAEFEARGVFLDDHSKTELMRYYEKLNLIEKKSDCGDAQYVKRIL